MYLDEQAGDIQVEGEAELLIAINEAECPERVEALRAEITSTPLDQVYSQCDAMGRFIGGGPENPDLLINRVSYCKMNLPDARVPARDAAFEVDYFCPNPKSVREIRRLVRIAVLAAQEGHSRFNREPELVTVEDYEKYIASFPPKVLTEMIRNLVTIEGTKGCTGPCLKKCATGALTGIKHQVPIDIIESLLKRAAEIFGESPSGIEMYLANDLRDYRYEGKTGVDLIEMANKILGANMFVSTVFTLDKKTVDFLFELLIVKRIKIDRISRLVSGLDPKDIDKLIEKLKLKAKNEQHEVRAYLWGFIENELRQAFYAGSKEGIAGDNLNIGNAVTPGMAEREIGIEPIGCMHGVVFIAGHGFYGKIIMPNSKLFPHGFLLYPILPDRDGRYHIPKVVYTNGLYIPGCIDDPGFRIRPRFAILDSEGEYVERGEESHAEAKLSAISRYKLSMTHAVNVSSRTMEDLCQIRTLRHFYDLADSPAYRTDVAKSFELLRELHWYCKKQMAILKAGIGARNKLLSDYAEDEDVRLEREFVDQFFKSLFLNECELIPEVLELLYETLKDSSRGEAVEELKKEIEAFLDDISKKIDPIEEKAKLDWPLE
ncbi:MAG: hypothetical protein WC285_01395 [Candidatus Gracilibacteria bacterium]|jgi:hypothetical protein